MKKRFQRIKQTATNVYEAGKKRVKRAQKAWKASANTGVVNRVASTVKAAVADS